MKVVLKFIVKSSTVAFLLVLSHPLLATTPQVPPPYMDVATLQNLCSSRYVRAQDQAQNVASCRGYVRGVVDRYFETDYHAKKRQLLPRCDWRRMGDEVVSEVVASIDGPVKYSSDSRAEPWLRAMLARKCGERP